MSLDGFRIRSLPESKLSPSESFFDEEWDENLFENQDKQFCNNVLIWIEAQDDK